MKNRSLTHRKLKMDNESLIPADGEAHPADLGHQMCYVLEGDGVSFGDELAGAVRRRRWHRQVSGVPVSRAT